jgi:hypothetical protein
VCGDIGTGLPFALHVRGGAQFMQAANGGTHAFSSVTAGRSVRKLVPLVR